MKTIEDAVRYLGAEWPSDEPAEVYLYKFAHGQYVAGVSGGTAKYICTRYEFEECAKKLRNEPSWKDAPNWVVARAQDSAGEWYWYEVVPRPNIAMFKGFPGKSKYAGKGEVIGDWRDTFKLRPEEKKTEDKNDWYAKGEFPPVGTVCRRRFATTGDEVVTITYVGDGVLCYRNEKGVEYTAVSAHIELRPIQTERERVVKAWTEMFDDSDILNAYLGGLYDIGALKIPEDK